MSDAEEILFLEHKRANLSADEIAMGIQKEHVVFNEVLHEVYACLFG